MRRSAVHRSVRHLLDCFATLPMTGRPDRIAFLEPRSLRASSAALHRCLAINVSDGSIASAPGDRQGVEGATPLR